MQNRYDFVLLFDVKDGNPNGDPDAGNLPRIDPETGQGLVTDVCIKRKIRNYVGVVKEEQPPFEIYVKEKAVLNRQHTRAYESAGIKSEPKKLPKKEEESKLIKDWMCRNFFDIRTFGAVMTTEVNCGQVRGPVQLAFARSVEPIVSQEHAVTRCAVTNDKDLEKERTMGRKFTVPYGLYRMHGFINPHLAAQTGFDANGEDLQLFWDALGRMFDCDRSASRGEMSARRLIVFKHESKLGNAAAHVLFDRVKIARRAKAEDAADGGYFPARSFEEFVVSTGDDSLPDGVSLHEMI